MSTPVPRQIIALLAVILAATNLIALPGALAQGVTRNTNAEAGFVASLNAQRAAGGLDPLIVNSSMVRAANGWTSQMANGNFLAHANDIVTGTPTGWSKIGENVGRGQSVESLTRAFMTSPGHRANIMDPTFTHLGVAVYDNPTDGRMYTTHRFAALPGAASGDIPAPVASVPTPTEAPATTTAPEPITPEPITPEPAAAPEPSPSDAPRQPTTSDTPDRFGRAPEQLAFVDTDAIADSTAAKLYSKQAKALAAALKSPW